MSDLARDVGRLSGGAGVYVLEDTVMLRVSGDDAQSWLNGVLTNDVRQLAPGGAVSTAIVNVRGKLLADAFVYDPGGDRRIAIPASAADAVTSFFDTYIIMEDVTIARDAEHAIVRVAGPRATEVSLRDDVPRLGVFTTDREGLSGRDWLVTVEHIGDVLRVLSGAAEPVGGGPVSADAVEVCRVRAGRGRWGIDMSESDFPQEVGLAPRSVSFQKGCYVGQEVVCMLEMRGQVKRRLVLLDAGEGVVPARGASIAHGTDKVGTVTSAVLDPRDGHAWALALIKRAASEPGSLLDIEGAGRASIVSLAT